ncbi:hypothetical protein BUALT_Bualt12G0052200 [Buddleja alternifolia]|uniref:RNase H type-1 domain-containing protein n=1 Tax=Buddleja alternifolia TaxID=168488 RepID=A0AAV6WQ42_9LAMI|nr:hypothetical protein BUALT_Bualt12G0052200 [Buddleja alternifolia]
MQIATTTFTSYAPPSPSAIPCCHQQPTTPYNSDVASLKRGLFGGRGKSSTTPSPILVLQICKICRFEEHLQICKNLRTATATELQKAAADGVRMNGGVGVVAVVLESDCRGAIHSIVDASTAHHQFDVITHIRDALNRDWTVDVQLVWREANKVADELAKMGFGSSLKFKNTPDARLQRALQDYIDGHTWTHIVTINPVSSFLLFQEINDEPRKNNHHLVLTLKRPALLKIDAKTYGEATLLDCQQFKDCSTNFCAADFHEKGQKLFTREMDCLQVFEEKKDVVGITPPNEPYKYCTLRQSANIFNFGGNLCAKFVEKLINDGGGGNGLLVSHIEAVKGGGEEPVSFGPNSLLVHYGSGWKLQTVVESIGDKGLYIGTTRVRKVPAKGIDVSDSTGIVTQKPIGLVYIGKILLVFVLLFAFGAVFTLALENLPRSILYVNSSDLDVTWM